ncbi:alpha-1A adrenergic receptor-like [Apostichopus japonicus]|uniref:alpha-1A adrenergic receptor-like n=1 Tax=Stichopus japonicus TaxID=307972 RepID=UPI003AB3925F
MSTAGLLNQTRLHGDSTEPSDVINVFAVISLIMIMLVSILWNVLALIAIKRTRSPQNNIHTLFIINLCVADLAIATTSIPFTLFDLLYEGYLLRSSILCNINGFLVTIFPAVNVQTVALIAVHRYVQTIHPHSVVVDIKRATLALVSVWSVSVTLATLPLTHLVSHIDYSRALHHCCPSFKDPCIYGYVCLTAYIVTIPASIFCYTSITRKLSQMAKTLNLRKKRVKPWNDIFYDDDTLPSSGGLAKDELSSTVAGPSSAVTTGNDRHRSRKLERKRAILKLAADKRVAIASALIIFTTITCWTPFALTNVCFLRGEIKPGFSIFILWLAYTNSVLDPIIYIFFNKSVCEKVKQTLKCR